MKGFRLDSVARKYLVELIVRIGIIISLFILIPWIGSVIFEDPSLLSEFLGFATGFVAWGIYVKKFHNYTLRLKSKKNLISWVVMFLSLLLIQSSILFLGFFDSFYCGLVTHMALIGWNTLLNHNSSM
jgi:hypothetical protein